MKKIITLFCTTLFFIACNNQNATIKEFKTGYVDTSKLMDESIEAKDIEEKYKDKSKEMGAKLEAEGKKLQVEADNFKRNAIANGQAWAQQKGAELQERDQQLQYAQQGMMQQLQQESGQEMDSLVKKYKTMFKVYGKEKGFDYVFGTGDAASVLYAKDNYDITKDLIKIVNDKYKNQDKTTAKEPKKSVKK